MYSEHTIKHLRCRGGDEGEDGWEDGWKEVLWKLEHFDKDFVKNTTKRDPAGNYFGVFS